MVRVFPHLSCLAFTADPPRKRVDVVQLTHINGQPRLSLGSLSEGSPVAPRRALTVQQLRRKNSLQNCSTPASPTTSPRLVMRQTSQLQTSTSDTPAAATPPGSPSVGSAAWRSRLHTIKNSFLGSPRFHRKKLQVPSGEDLSNSAGESSSEFTKKSWFGALMGTEHEEHCFIMIKDKNIGQIKADLIHAFLCMPDLSHSVVSPTSFRAEYRRTGSSSVFTRNIRLQVDVAPVRKDEEDGAEETQLHCLTFTLLSGPSRRFKRLCELFQSMLMSVNRGPATARRISSDLASNSSSSSYNSMDRMSPTPPDDCCFEKKPSNNQSSQGLVNGRRALGDAQNNTTTSSSRDLKL